MHTELTVSIIIHEQCIAVKKFADVNFLADGNVVGIILYAYPMVNLPHVGSGAVRIGLLHFQAGGPQRQPNLAVVFLCLFCVLVFLCSE